MQGRGLYIATEGANGVGRLRIPGWYDAHNIPEAERQNLLLWPKEISFDNVQDVDAIIESLASAIYGEGFNFICADIFGGLMDGSETKDETARAWVRGVQRIIREAGVTVLTIAHTGWMDQTRARMHTHFWGSFDTRLKAEGDKESRTTILSVDRHKDADSLGSWGFDLVQAHTPDGRTTLVPQLNQDVATKARNKDVATKARKKASEKPMIALQALDDALAEYGKQISSKDLPACPVVEIDRWKAMCRRALTKSNNSDTQKKAFGRARKHLEVKGLARTFGGFAWRVSE